MLALAIFLLLIVGLGVFLIITKKNEGYWHGWRGGWRGWRRPYPGIYSNKDFVLLSEKDCIEFGCEEACKQDKNTKECKECKLSCLE